MNAEDAFLTAAAILTVACIVQCGERKISADTWRYEAVMSGNARWVKDRITGERRWEWIDHAAPATQPSPEASTK